MTAAALATVVDSAVCTIDLIESDAIGSVGVGEATIPAIHDFNRKVGLDERDFMRSTNATFKLGIEFVGWGRTGDAYMHPFGRSGYDINGVAFHHYWVDRQRRGFDVAFDEYSVAGVAARLGRFAHPQADPHSVLSTFAYAFHFDASLYAQYLRRVSEGRGVKRTEGRIVDVALHPETGDIRSVTLEGGREIGGELFIDCSGFRALLIEGALGTAFTSWQQWLPCDRAAAVPSSRAASLDPYTRSTAQRAGWQWRIPLQHRTGNGHVYSSSHLGDDEAIAIALENIEGEALDEARVLRFVAGRREQMWTKNCVAIGLSGGFLEPLESTSIYLIQAAIMKLIERFPDRSFDPASIADFNAQMNRHFEQIRDFIILHYKANNRGDSEFWEYCRNMAVPESLEHRLETFRECGHVVFSERELFIEPNWVAVLLGQGVVPRQPGLRVDCIPSAVVDEQMQRMRALIRRSAESLPAHADMIARYCAADA